MRKKTEVPNVATHEEICDFAIKHYEKISSICCDWLSTIPKAIEFYKKYYPEIKAREDVERITYVV